MSVTPDSGLRDAASRPASFGQTIKAVAWSFFGIRKRAGYEQDVQRLNPVHVIVAGVLAAFVFIVTLVLLVRWVVGSGVTGT
jgi:hypothetical protein